MGCDHVSFSCVLVIIVGRLGVTTIIVGSLGLQSSMCHDGSILRLDKVNLLTAEV